MSGDVRLLSLLRPDSFKGVRGGGLPSCEAADSVQAAATIRVGHMNRPTSQNSSQQVSHVMHAIAGTPRHHFDVGSRPDDRWQTRGYAVGNVTEWGHTMMDFATERVFRLSQVDRSEVEGQLTTLLVEGEQIFLAFKGGRDFVVFTDKRIIAVDVQGMRGSKKDYTSLPYAKITAFSVETAGTFDRDAELELWLSGLGRAKFEFKGKSDVAYMSRLIAHYVL